MCKDLKGVSVCESMLCVTLLDFDICWSPELLTDFQKHSREYTHGTDQ